MRNLFLLFFALLFSVSFAQKSKIFLTEAAYPEMGAVKFYMTVTEKSDGAFYAYSNPETLYRALPLVADLYLKIFGKGRKNGAVLRIMEGSVTGKKYKGKAISQFGNFNFEGVIDAGGRLSGTLENKGKRIHVSGVQVESKTAIEDYRAIGEDFQKTVTHNIYNPALLNDKEWQSFMKKMKRTFHKAYDDLDVATQFYINKRKLKTSHVYLTKEHPGEVSDVGNNFKTESLAPNITLLTINQFSVKDTLSINEILQTMTDENLIVDLRNCRGGDFSSLMLAAHFIDRPYRVGLFLGQKYFIKSSGQLPSEEELSAESAFTSGDLNEFDALMKQRGVVVGEVRPSGINYKGNIYLLTSRYTASAAEPLTYFLKEINRAEIVGEKTAGQMLSSASFKLKSDWWLTLPVADYFTNDGIRLEGRGVTPDIGCAASGALDLVLKKIEEEQTVL